MSQPYDVAPAPISKIPTLLGLRDFNSSSPPRCHDVDLPTGFISKNCLSAGHLYAEQR